MLNSTMELFVVNGSSPEFLQRALELQSNAYIVALTIMPFVFSVVGTLILPLNAMTLIRVTYAFHRTTLPFLLNLLCLVFFRCLGVAALNGRSLYVHFAVRRSSQRLQSAFDCHIWSETPKLLFSSIGANLFAILIERLVANICLVAYDGKKLRWTVTIVLFIATYTPTSIHGYFFIRNTLTLDGSSLNVLYCDGMYGKLNVDEASFEDALFLWNLSITVLVAVVSAVLLARYNYNNKHYLEKQAYDLNERHRLHENIVSTNVILWYALIFFLLQVVTQTTHIFYFIIDLFELLTISGELKIIFSQIATLMVPLFAICYSCATFRYCRKHFFPSPLRFFFCWCVKEPLPVHRDVEINPNHIGAEFEAHFKALRTQWERLGRRQQHASRFCLDYGKKTADVGWSAWLSPPFFESSVNMSLLPIDVTLPVEPTVGESEAIFHFVVGGTGAMAALCGTVYAACAALTVRKNAYTNTCINTKKLIELLLWTLSMMGVFRIVADFVTVSDRAYHRNTNNTDTHAPHSLYGSVNFMNNVDLANVAFVTTTLLYERWRALVLRKSPFGFRSFKLIHTTWIIISFIGKLLAFGILYENVYLHKSLFGITPIMVSLSFVALCLIPLGISCWLRSTSRTHLRALAMSTAHESVKAVIREQILFAVAPIRISLFAVIVLPHTSALECLMEFYSIYAQGVVHVCSNMMLALTTWYMVHSLQLRDPNAHDGQNGSSHPYHVA